MRWQRRRGVHLSQYEHESRLREAAAAAAREARTSAREELAAEGERRRLLDDQRSQTAAEQILRQVASTEGPVFSDLAQRGLLADLPLTPAGDLHAEAFRALVDREIWRIRFNALDTQTGRTTQP